ncbi:MAG: Smr/MutS family protein [Deltaproteobacteria bacterium]|nr:Smr/MutS family protein [Deltaproteobacteria bacterium]
MQDAIERLEFGAIRAALLARVHTPLGAAEVNGLLPFAERAQALDRIEAVRQARLLLDLSSEPPVAGAEDVSAALELGEKGVMLEGPQLRAIAHTMNAGAAVRRHLLGREADAPTLFALGASMADLSRTAGQVLRCFDPDGQLSDDASPDLGPLRQKVRALRENISAKLSELLTSSKMQPLLQENYYTIRADRYVLPIKASFKNEVKGIVHDASGSGQTVYIEPQIVVDLGNRLKIAQSEQLEEEHRILSNLTRLVSREADHVRLVMHVVGVVDLLFGAGRLANDLRCEAVKPGPAPGFSLVRARHPILLLQAMAPPPVVEEGAEPPPPRTGPKSVDEVVGNDFALEAGQRVLVITGPNTGGKTVAMKTIGLFALMARMGLHLPCGEGSRIGWYDRVEVAIGDQQSIASNLSTFAAHVKRLVQILKRAGEGDLVLIDEIAADTDPNQGQALGQAILERLADRHAHVIVTTHFERLKAVPFIDERFRNAGVGFDANRLKPTFHVTLDVPQGSSGFDIAQGLGLPAELVDRARALTGEGSQELELLIKQIESRSAELEQARLQVDEAEARARAAEARAREKERTLGEEIDRVRRRARTELLAEIEARQGEVGRIVAELQQAAESEAVKEAMRKANQARDQLGKIAKAEAEKAAQDTLPKPEPAEPLSTVEVGAWVHVPRVGRDGDVVAVDGKEAQVVVGNIRMRVPVASLRTAKGKRPKQSARPAPKDFKKKERTEPAGEEGPKVIVEELDVRGATVDECLDRLDGFLDYHYGMPTTHVRVVHGHGTGALKEAVREHLRRSGYVREMRPGEKGEGGDGVTVVALS